MISAPPGTRPASPPRPQAMPARPRRSWRGETCEAPPAQVPKERFAVRGESAAAVHAHATRVEREEHREHEAISGDEEPHALIAGRWKAAASVKAAKPGTTLRVGSPRLRAAPWWAEAR